MTSYTPQKKRWKKEETKLWKSLSFNIFQTFYHSTIKLVLHRLNKNITKQTFAIALLISDEDTNHGQMEPWLSGWKPWMTGLFDLKND